MTTVSVVIPTYERPKYLPGAIQTALGQTYENIEIIVVDDGSTEPYADEIGAEFPESVTCVRHEENKGLSAARNTGIENASGEYIAFLDDDDRWHQTKIERQVQALETNSDAGLATCLVAAVTPDRELAYCENGTAYGDCAVDLLVGNQIGTPSRVLVREKCIDEVGGFDESLPTKQDWDFYIRLSQKWDIEAVEDHLCFRTVHESMSSSPESAARDTGAILEKHEDLIRRHGRWTQARAEISGRVGRAYLRQYALRDARQKFARAFRLSPSGTRALLFLLSFTHPVIVGHLTDLKHWLSLKRNGCSDPEIFEGVIFDGGDVS